MSDELVERLAVVICESDTVQPMGWEDVTAHWQDNYRTQARVGRYQSDWPCNLR